MEKRYIIGIDQSTQGTKALLFDGEGHLLRRTDLPHRQIVNEKGWVSHDLNEIYRNTVQTVKTLVTESGVAPETIAGIGISNQRETTAIWIRRPGNHWKRPLYGSADAQAGLRRRLRSRGTQRRSARRRVCSFRLIFLLQRWRGCFETAEKKDRNVLQTGSSALAPSTAGWFTS